jgi:hypothetical protein
MYYGSYRVAPKRTINRDVRNASDDASLCQADSGPASQTAPPRPAARGVGIGKVGIGVSVSTLGIGPQVAVSIGTGKLTFRTPAPELRVGWGNLVPRSHQFSFTVEVGIEFMGKPQSKLALGGTACLGATQLLCVPAATDPIIQQRVAAEQNKINNNAKYAQFWPMFAMTFGYRF